MRYLLLSIALLLFLGGVPVSGAPLPVIRKDTIFEVKDGRLLATKAKHAGSGPFSDPKAGDGWKARTDDDYYSFDAVDVLSSEQGTLTIKLAVADKAKLSSIGSSLETLLTLYDKDGTAFFAVGINDHDVMVGSFPLHPMIMEDAFGGVGFPYVKKLDGPLSDGTEIAVTVTWGELPSDDLVFVNNRLIEKEIRRGPRTLGKSPGYDPTRTLGSFLHGFTAMEHNVGEPAVLTIGRMGKPDTKNLLDMYQPKSILIKSVYISNLIEPPALSARSITGK